MKFSVKDFLSKFRRDKWICLPVLKKILNRKFQFLCRAYVHYTVFILYIQYFEEHRTELFYMRNCFRMTAQYTIQKHTSRSVLRKRCPENMQQIYGRTLIPKCDFNKIAKQLYWNQTSSWVFACKFAVYFQNTFL